MTAITLLTHLKRISSSQAHSQMYPNELQENYIYINIYIYIICAEGCTMHGHEWSMKNNKSSYGGEDNLIDGDLNLKETCYVLGWKRTAPLNL